MPEQLPPLSPQDNFDRSFIEDNDWLSGVFPRRKHSKARALHVDPVELQTQATGDALPTMPQDGDRPAEAAGKALSDTSSYSPPPVPMRYRDDVFGQARVVKRVLEWYHIFFIALSGTLGVGLYVQGGSILRLGGPWALIISFVVMAILSWSVMQGISEMLCIWPISGALYEYVSVFVDQEVGEAVGIAYWFTNSMGFAAIMMTAAGEVGYWSTNGYLKGFLILSGVPAMLVGINTLGVRLYGWIELVGGSLKLSFVLTIIVTTLAIVLGAGQDSQSAKSKWHGSHYDKAAAKNHPIAFFMCLPIAAFAFVGIEITAAAALEAKPSTRRQTVPTTRLKRPATKLPLVVGTIYVLAAIMVALAVDANSPSLPPQGWVTRLIQSNSKSDSAFVQAAEAAQIYALPSVITAFIVFTAVTAANTALYVASRTLFGLARESGSWFGYFGVTDGTHRVPLRALWASAIFFFVGYFCYLPSQDGVNAVSDVLSNMSSGSCVIVWGFESVAYLRFYYCIKRHATSLESEPETGLTPFLRRFYKGTPEPGTTNYPWKSHGQPFVAIFSACGCLFIIIIANQASLWSGFHWQPFLSSFLAPICFILLIIVLKLRRHEFKKWSPLAWSWGVSLIHYDEVLLIFQRLQSIRTNSIPAEVTSEAPAEAGVSNPQAE